MADIRRSRLLRFRALLENLEYEYTVLLQNVPEELEVNEEIPRDLPCAEPPDQEGNEVIPLEKATMLAATCLGDDDKPLSPEKSKQVSFLLGSESRAKVVDHGSAKTDRRSANTDHNSVLQEEVLVGGRISKMAKEGMRDPCESVGNSSRVTWSDEKLVDRGTAKLDRHSIKTDHSFPLKDGILMERSISKMAKDCMSYSSKTKDGKRSSVGFLCDSEPYKSDTKFVDHGLQDEVPVTSIVVGHGSLCSEVKVTDTMELSGRFTADGKFIRSRRSSMLPIWFNPDKKVLAEMMMESANREQHADPSQKHPKVRCLLSPVAFPKLHWDLFAFGLIFYDAWATSFQMVFQSDDLELAWMRYGDHAVTCFFALDIVTNFNTGLITRRDICFQRDKIARRYLKGWFWLDLMATIPYDQIYQGASFAGFLRFLKMVKFLKVIRLVRLRNTIKYLQRSENVYFQVMAESKKIIAMMGLMLLLLLNVHLFCCLWLALDGTVQTDTFSKVSHVYFDTYAAIFFTLLNGTRLDSKTTSMKLLEMVISAEQFIMISLFCAYAIFEALMLYGDAARSRVMRDQVRRYMVRHGLPLKTQIEVLFGLDEARSARALQKDFIALTTVDLPEELRQRVTFELWEKNFMKLDLFVRVSEWDGGFCRSLSLLCREEVFATDVVIFQEHDASIAAYYIVTGELKVSCALMDVDFPSFREGTWVGESSLVNPLGRRGLKVVSLALSSVMVVAAESFQKLLKESNLWHRFEECVRSELFFGLCGRCGSIGDHFFDSCPHEQSLFRLTVSTQKSRCPCWPSAGGAHSNLEQAKFREVVDFLHHFDAMHLLPYLQKLQVCDLSQLESLDVDSLERVQPPDELSRRDKKVLSAKCIKMYRQAMEHHLIEEHDVIEDDLHLVFLSHYKLEAGTEAALMRSELEKVLEQFLIEDYMFKVPIFLDSEDLTTLSELEEHVKKSFNIVLLLTRGVLSRPWVLVELVTAVRCGIPVVPVKVVKPGVEFTFPDEKFYADLLAGKYLDEAGEQLLRDCNISWVLIEQTLRKVFQNIAGIYSPHRPAQVRHAELLELLGSCKIKDNSVDDMLRIEAADFPVAATAYSKSVATASGTASRSDATKGSSMRHLTRAKSAQWRQPREMLRQSDLFF